MNLPFRIFFTGVPGSRWSGISQHIEKIPGVNTSDRSYERTYEHGSFSGHKGAYFGRLMELEAKLDQQYIDSAWSWPLGTRVVKSHDWAYMLDRIKAKFPNDWIMLVHRPDQAAFDWWKEAGGFDIKYPSYAAYINDDIMKREISWQNQSILKFAEERNASWEAFDSEWIEKHFNAQVDVDRTWPDIKVTLIK